MSLDSTQRFSEEKDLFFSRELPESREEISRTSLHGNQVTCHARSSCLISSSDCVSVGWLWEMWTPGALVEASGALPVLQLP